MKFKDNVPIYLQIKSLINQQIIAGKYALGAKLPSVRDLSVQLEVNINTIQKAINELVQEGVVVTKRGLGNFVTENLQIVDELKEQLINQTIGDMYESLTAMGLDQGEIFYYLKIYLAERMKKNDNSSEN
ncbi:GntR family transcriptional regulator [Bombilactobacillus mellis]|uniref:GntR family transcriptional regulator n=1 Tax=Bombilactobacillus mellis TaxID=1218508 RepID=UPI00157FF7A0|nr:GntR family transcriptional regulator [Bombilactobacillus mellis]MBI0107991.1 GntR family transcriptional regulator [Lactobacillus sp. W8086]MBI0109412.1 GntR family transcriptional regulator [Lactobacillus sp. W8085]MBI0112673.1 GntR family transcriptional regulator [Lactobacillus sp. W8088]MBI0116389.1 GntR family transcriptional regulator [Lactobacillus sp. W8087]MBI0120069.1 GntR family transcriptional regulator [Lactobacillus sp. W8089]MBI0132034.1 GntR family transcriptional regulato